MSSHRLQDVYKLSPTQAGMLFHSLMGDTGAAYIEQICLDCRGTIDSKILEDSFNALLERYDILRTVFQYEDLKRPLQIVLRRRKMTIHSQDISALDSAGQIVFLEDYKLSVRQGGFDLSRDLLLKIALFKTGPQSFTLVWSSHHIVMDGWCLGIVYKDLTAIYTSLKNGVPHGLPPVAQYKKYIQWLDRQKPGEAQRFWKDYLDGYDRKAGFSPVDKGKKPGDYRLREYLWQAPEELSRQLGETVAGLRVTINTFFQAVWGILLQNYNATDDVVFGSVVSVRPPVIPGIESMVGLFVNTVPMRIQTHDGQRFDQLVRNLHKSTSAAKSYEFVPLAETQAHTPLREHLFDHLVSFQNFPIQEEIKQIGSDPESEFSIEDVHIHEQTHYHLNVMVGFAGNLSVNVNYNERFYRDSFVRELVLRLERLLVQVTEDCRRPVLELDIILDEEKKQILEAFNRPTTHFPSQQTIPELFRQAASRYPNLQALSYGFASQDASESMTYRELEQKISRMAAFLQGKGVGPDAIVALRFRRSFDMIVAIFGILEAGGAYLPIDPDYPRQRALYMLNDSNARLMLGDDDLDHRELDAAGQTEIVAFSAAMKEAGDVEVCDTGLTPGDLAYVIYTSGTTGKPKGSLIQHDNVVSLLFHQPFPFDFSHRDVWTLFHSYCFDFSVWEIFGALLYGGRLVVISSDAARDPGLFLDILEREQVTVLNQTPSSFYNIAAQSRDHNNLRLSLRYVIFGGEALQSGKLQYWRDRFKGIRFINMYGITETTVHVTFKEIQDEDIVNDRKSIGSPLATLKVLIAGRQSRMMPSGVPGEILVSGAGVCRGYLNRPELTAEKFAGEPRLYRSGDKGRLTVGGELEYLGRIDSQVKIRGYRIEPEEIEAVLRSHQGVDDALVRVKTGDDNDRSLCAYVIPGHDLVSIRGFMEERLPSYMIPSYFIPMKTFPLTANGKLDASALPGPMETAPAPLLEPEGPIEAALAEFFGRVLDSDSSLIGRDSSFFELGGHSLKAVSLANVIHQELKVKLPIQTIFLAPTVRRLALEVKKGEQTHLATIPTLEPREYYELSYSQKRMWVLQSRNPRSAAFNMPDQIAFDHPLDVDVMKRSFHLLASRHEALRTHLLEVDGDVMQVILPAVEIPVEYLDLSALTEKKRGDRLESIWQWEAETGFDLYQAPLARVKVIKISDNDWYVLFNIHHIVSDGWSMAVLRRDLLSIYESLDSGREPELEPSGTQYKDYAHWHNRALEDRDTLDEALSFWRRHLAGPLPVLNLPYDFSPGQNKSRSGGAFRAVLGDEATGKLKELAVREKCSYFMVTLAAVNLLLSQLREQDDILIGLPGAAREHPGLRQTVGLFVNTLVLRTRIHRELSFLDFLAGVRKDAMKVLEYQGYPLELIVDELGVEYPRFSLFFNMLNMADSDDILPDHRSFHLEGVQDAKFDLEFYIKEYRNGTVILCSYFNRLFLPETIEKITARFVAILETIAADPTLPLKEYRGSKKKPKILKKKA